MEDDRDAVPTRIDRPGATPRPQERASEEPILGRASTSQRYLADREIARGGMGRVVEAIDTVLGRTVALKEALVDDDETLRRFDRETRITAKLEHPSIVPVYDAGTAPDGTHFYVMRKVSGQPLDKLVDAATTLDARLKLVPHVLAAAQAIAHAHQRSILHRDVKPPNILIGELGETIVIDWGLAKELDERDEDDPASRTASQSLMTRYGAIVGTPGFMPPEQVKGEPVDERGDVFALGATLYYVLSGKPPFGGHTGDDVLRDTLERPAKPLHQAVPNVPAELATIADKALAAAAEDRYRDAGALAIDLQRFLAGQLVASHDYSTVERALRFVRRHRIAVGAVSVAVIVLAVVSALAFDRIIDARDAASAEAERANAERASADEARKQANDRADELTLDKARLMIASDPTLAVAQIKRLASSPIYWREVRDIAAAARAAGVAWELPAPAAKHVSVIGELAITSGSDGAIRKYDLRAHTVVELAKLPAWVYAAVSADGRRIVGYSKSKLIRIDLATGARSDTTAEGDITSVALLPGVTVYAQIDKLWLLRDDSTTPVRLELEGKMHMGGIWVAPDASWFGSWTQSGIEMFALPSLARTFIPCTLCYPEALSADGAHLLATNQANQQVTLIDIPFAAPRSVRRTPGPRPTNSIKLTQWGLHVFPGGEVRARGDAVIEPGERAVAVRSPIGDAALLVASRIIEAKTSPTSPFVVALTDQKLSIWNLDDILPRALPATGRASFAGPGSVLLREPPAWLDLDTGESVPVPLMATKNAGALVTTQFHDAAIVSGANHMRQLLLRRGKPPLDVSYSSGAIALVDPQHLVRAELGMVDLFDLETAENARLTSRDIMMKWVVGNPRWIVAGYMDDQVWRYDRSTGRSQLAALFGVVPAEAGQVIANSESEMVSVDGTVFGRQGARVRAWRTDDIKVELVAPQPIKSLEPIDRELAIAVFEHQPPMMAVVSDPPRLLAAPVRDPRISHSTSLRLVADSSVPTELRLSNDLTGLTWVLGRARAPYTDATIAPDEHHVLAHLGPPDHEVPVVWTIDWPTTPAATSAWLDRLTNVSAAR